MDVRIGRGSAIHLGARFDMRHNFTMGANSVINERCRLDNRGTITIGDNVSISSEVVILTADHDVREDGFATRKKPVKIGNRVFVGTRAMLLPGVSVGEGAVIAAGALVTKNVEAFTIVAGNPARKIGERPRTLTYTVSYDRLLH